MISKCIIIAAVALGACALAQTGRKCASIVLFASRAHLVVITSCTKEVSDAAPRDRQAIGLAIGPSACLDLKRLSTFTNSHAIAQCANQRPRWA